MPLLMSNSAMASGWSMRKVTQILYDTCDPCKTIPGIFDELLDVGKDKIHLHVLSGLLYHLGLAAKFFGSQGFSPL